MIIRQKSLAEQVRAQILEWIRSGEIDPQDGPLPSEQEIAVRLNISRATVREALTLLERERLIIRRQGSGTYINPTVRQLSLTINEALEPQLLITAQGQRPKLGFRRVEWSLAGEEAAEALNVAKDDPAVRVSLLYLADEQPAVWLEGVLACELLQPNDEALPVLDTLAQFVMQLSGFRITHSVARLNAVEASAEMAHRLGVEAGKALLRVVDTHLSDYGQPVFYSHTYYVPERVRLEMLRDSGRHAAHISVW
jgi:GntR family transcriptional regulator